MIQITFLGTVSEIPNFIAEQLSKGFEIISDNGKISKLAKKR